MIVLPRVLSLLADKFPDELLGTAILVTPFELHMSPGTLYDQRATQVLERLQADVVVFVQKVVFLHTNGLMRFWGKRPKDGRLLRIYSLYRGCERHETPVQLIKSKAAQLTIFVKHDHDELVQRSQMLSSDRLILDLSVEASQITTRMVHDVSPTARSACSVTLALHIGSKELIQSILIPEISRLSASTRSVHGLAGANQI